MEILIAIPFIILSLSFFGQAFMLMDKTSRWMLVILVVLMITIVVVMSTTLN